MCVCAYVCVFSNAVPVQQFISLGYMVVMLNIELSTTNCRTCVCVCVCVTLVCVCVYVCYYVFVCVCVFSSCTTVHLAWTLLMYVLYSYAEHKIIHDELQDMC